MSFINPHFFFAAAVAALPIIFHLIRKMRIQKVQFSSLMFLQSVPKEMVRRRRLQDLLLLLMRCAMLGLLAFAFSRPYFEQENTVLTTAFENKSAIILIDNSYSMQFGDHFSQAQSAARQQIQDGRSGDEFAIIQFCDAPEQLTELNDNHSIHRNAIDNRLILSNRTTDFYKPMRLAEEILKKARHKNREIILISDLQENGWGSQIENLKLMRGTILKPVKIATENAANTYIDAYERTQKRAGSTIAAQYGVRLRTTAAAATESGTIRFISNGEEIDAQPFQLADANRLFFQQRDLREGIYQGFFSLTPDELAIDNHQYFSFQINKQPEIYCIEPSPKSRGSNAFFLQNCFDLGEQSFYQFSATAPDAVKSSKLNAANIVFLADQRSISNAQLKRYQQYVNGGGTLVISFGDRTDIAKFSENLKALEIGSIQERTLVRTLQPTKAIIGEAEMNHPIFTVFAKSGAGDIFKPKFSDYLKIAPDSTAQVIAKYDTGDPAIIEQTLGAGKVLVFTSTLNTQWGDFPVNEIYLPFMYQIVKYALSSQNQQAGFLVGASVPLHGDPQATWQITTPENSIETVQADDDGRAYFNATDIPGNYRAESNGRTTVFSVNIDPRESDLTGKNPQEFTAALTPALNQTEKAELQARLDLPADIEKRQKLWQYILFLVIILFFAESFFANRRAGFQLKRKKEAKP